MKKQHLHVAGESHDAAILKLIQGMHGVRYEYMTIAVYAHHIGLSGTRGSDGEFLHKLYKMGWEPVMSCAAKTGSSICEDVVITLRRPVQENGNQEGKGE